MFLESASLAQIKKSSTIMTFFKIILLIQKKFHEIEEAQRKNYTAVQQRLREIVMQ